MMKATMKDENTTVPVRKPVKKSPTLSQLPTVEDVEFSPQRTSERSPSAKSKQSILEHVGQHSLKLEKSKSSMPVEDAQKALKMQSEEASNPKNLRLSRAKSAFLQEMRTALAPGQVAPQLFSSPGKLPKKETPRPAPLKSPEFKKEETPNNRKSPVGQMEQISRYYISSWVKNTNSFRNLINTSKGRDKVCQFIQYVASFYISCMRTSDDPDIRAVVRQKKEPSVNRAKKLESNISSGRKIFRLLLWLNEISEIENLINNKKMDKIHRVLKICSTCCSFAYYMADNIVWLAGMGYMSPRIFHYKWKQIKNTFSLWKTILEVIISVYTVILKNREEKMIISKLAHYSRKQVQLDTEQYVLVRELILLRRQRNFNIIEFLIYMSRMCLLTSALKLPFSDWLRPVFVASCGLFQSGMQVFKQMRGKKHFHKLTIQDVHERSQKRQEEKEAKAKQVHTILVPYEKQSDLNAARSRGMSANPSLDFSFNKGSLQAQRTRSGGGAPWGRNQTSKMLAFKGDLLDGHTILEEGDKIDESNRHVILRLINELKNKLHGATSTETVESEPSIQTAQGSQGNQGLLRAQTSTRMPPTQRRVLTTASQNLLANEALSQQLDQSEIIDDIYDSKLLIEPSHQLSSICSQIDQIKLLVSADF